MASTKRRTKPTTPSETKPSRPSRAKPQQPKSKPRRPARTKTTKGRKARRQGGASKIDQHVKVEIPQPNGKTTTKTMTVGDAIVAVLASGCSIDTAAAVVGIGRTTIYDWIALGQEYAAVEKPPAGAARFLDFSNAVTRAREQVVQLALAGVLEAGKSDWRAWAWFLERSRPDEFGRRTRHDFGDGEGGTMTLAELMAAASTDPSRADDAEDPDIE